MTPTTMKQFTSAILINKMEIITRTPSIYWIGMQVPRDGNPIQKTASLEQLIMEIIRTKEIQEKRFHRRTEASKMNNLGCLTTIRVSSKIKTLSSFTR